VTNDRYRGDGLEQHGQGYRADEDGKKLGAHMTLVVAPYYNRPTEAGLYRHFRQIAEEVDIPLILYNIPSRTGVNMLPDLVAQLAQIPNIAGIKEASGSVQQAAEIYRLTKGNFPFSQETTTSSFHDGCWGDRRYLGSLEHTARPNEGARDAFLEEKDPLKALDLHVKLMPFFHACSPRRTRTSKEALYYMGLIEREIRPPLCALSEENSASLRELLKEHGLLR